MKSSWNQGAGSAWGTSVERLPDLDPSEIVRGKYSHQHAPNHHRHRIVKILRLYGPLTVGDIVRKETGDMSSSRDRQNQRFYSALRFMEEKGQVVYDREIGKYRVHDTPESLDSEDVERWLDGEE